MAIKVDAGFIDEAVFVLLRKGGFPSFHDRDFFAYFRRGLPGMRSRVAQEDEDWICEMIERCPGEAVVFYVGLVRGLVPSLKVRESLCRAWKNTECRVKRFGLIWALVRDPALPQEMQEEIFEFVRGDWDAFNQGANDGMLFDELELRLLLRVSVAFE